MIYSVPPTCSVSHYYPLLSLLHTLHSLNSHRRKNLKSYIEQMCCNSRRQETAVKTPGTLHCSQNAHIDSLTSAYTMFPAKSIPLNPRCDLLLQKLMIEYVVHYPIIHCADVSAEMSLLTLCGVDDVRLGIPSCIKKYLRKYLYVIPISAISDTRAHTNVDSSEFEEWRLLGYKNTVCTSQGTHYVSATESNQLMLCKIWGFPGSDYEECRLLGYKTPVRTWQETHYVSATEPSRLMLCKIWGFHGGDYEECRVLGYKTPVRTWQETHYVSATESSRLMLRKIGGFHGGDYEDCRLLGYKNPVPTSQETHYVSAIEFSQLMLCKIGGFHGGDYEECRLLEWYAVWLL
jgi:hypothetical protein